MIRFDDLALFVRTAALGSFSNAAREADLLPGQVSAAIQRLERELDVRLFRALDTQPAAHCGRRAIFALCEGSAGGLAGRP